MAAVAIAERRERTSGGGTSRPPPTINAAWTRIVSPITIMATATTASIPSRPAVNNVFHRREHRYGVRLEPSTPWFDLGAKLATAEGAVDIAKSDVGGPIAADAGKLMKQLEAEGKVTPWDMVDVASW